ncbi:hypothetical protein AC579_4467 [Pseudocercospora musae]|uniref:Uncharacterized protein n=1 Tax=Pseudocercospora musae TaxID=113226 RepID=A0A139GZ78_9PEZI|nr:hypothetical protein AC579_4467 [Pseudocercospora musae]
MASLQVANDAKAKMEPVESFGVSDTAQDKHQKTKDEIVKEQDAVATALPDLIWRTASPLALFQLPRCHFWIARKASHARLGLANRLTLRYLAIGRLVSDTARCLSSQRETVIRGWSTSYMLPRSSGGHTGRIVRAVKTIHHPAMGQGGAANHRGSNEVQGHCG